MKKSRLALAVLALLANALAVSAAGPPQPPVSSPQTQTPAATPTISLSVDAINAAELSRLVSKQAQFRFVYVRSDPQQPLSLELHRLPVEELAKVLASQGAVAFSKDLADAAALQEDLLAARLSLATQDADGRMVADLLAQISNDRIVFRPRNAESRLALDVKRLPVGELPRVLAQFGDVSFAPRP